jgi:hypothetical protein
MKKKLKCAIRRRGEHQSGYEIDEGHSGKMEGKN